MNLRRFSILTYVPLALLSVHLSRRELVLCDAMSEGGGTKGNEDIRVEEHRIDHLPEGRIDEAYTAQESHGPVATWNADLARKPMPIL